MMVDIDMIPGHATRRLLAYLFNKKIADITKMSIRLFVLFPRGLGIGSDLIKIPQ
jgi:hypothetical protein